jgi:hypothetical protein
LKLYKLNSGIWWIFTIIRLLCLIIKTKSGLAFIIIFSYKVNVSDVCTYIKILDILARFFKTAVQKETNRCGYRFVERELLVAVFLPTVRCFPLSVHHILWQNFHQRLSHSPAFIRVKQRKEMKISQKENKHTHTIWNILFWFL